MAAEPLAGTWLTLLDVVLRIRLVQLIIIVLVKVHRVLTLIIHVQGLVLALKTPGSTGLRLALCRCITTKSQGTTPCNSFSLGFLKIGLRISHLLEMILLRSIFQILNSVDLNELFRFLIHWMSLNYIRQVLVGSLSLVQRWRAIERSLLVIILIHSWLSLVIIL